MRKRLLLLGGTGFVGKHLEMLCAETYEVFVSGHLVDVRDSEAVFTLVNDVRPDHVIHLAAITTLNESFERPVATYEINFIGVLNTLFALRKIKFLGTFLFVSSSEVYGLLSEDDLPVSEIQPVRPVSPYAVSKVAAEALCYQWSQSERFKVIIARPFNHIGPGQSERFAIANFGKQIAKIKVGITPPVIKVGDIETTRDFTDVRDIARAYKDLLDYGQNGEVYNICSGMERRVRSLIEIMCESIGVNVEIQADANRFRASEQRRVAGCNRKIRDQMGWAVGYTLEHTLRDIVEYWLLRVVANEK